MEYLPTEIDDTLLNKIKAWNDAALAAEHSLEE